MSERSDHELVFLPLGGAGEIGMNLNLYGFGPPGRHRWLMVDLGVTFGDGKSPGMDVIMPDPAFIMERRESLDGLVLTHAHEDHLGAVPYLWERLECPVFATPFTAAVLRRKLAEFGLVDRMPVTEVPLGGRIRVGPFELELITLTHSIPEPNAVVIRCPAGTVLHTGDWKFDPDPVVGPPADEAALRRVGDEGVLAMVCDSTNVFVEGESGSESDLLGTLTDLVGRCDGRVVVTCFASNVARLETITAAAAANGRDVVIAGRTLRRIEGAARETGYLANVPAFIDEEYAGYLPRDRMLVICTGSQGEPRAALARIAAASHRNVGLEAGDTVIFSSRVIPGNETSIARVQDQLAGRGVSVITWQDRPVHVSGHAARDELVRMYQLVRPRIAVPVHGEVRHLVEHARLARRCQVPEAHVAENGTIVRLGPGESGVTERVASGRLYVDGNRLVPTTGAVVQSRNRAIHNGAAVLTVVINGKGRLARAPELASVGLLEADEEDGVRELMSAAVRRTVDDLSCEDRAVDDVVREAVRIAARRAIREAVGKRPVTTVHLVRMEGEEI